jgi:PncC family amidohydrolase
MRARLLAAADILASVTDLLKRVHLLLRAGGNTIATAESLTGGRLAVALTDVPGASETYLGGVVTYATELKASVLDVDERIIEEYGVVSPECARAMASGVRALTGATFGVSTTGVAGPDDQEGKPPRTVFVGIAAPGMLEAVALELAGKRREIQDRTCHEALEALEAVLRREETPLG